MYKYMRTKDKGRADNRQPAILKAHKLCSGELKFIGVERDINMHK